MINTEIKLFFLILKFISLNNSTRNTVQLGKWSARSFKSKQTRQSCRLSPRGSPLARKRTQDVLRISFSRWLKNFEMPTYVNLNKKKVQLQHLDKSYEKMIQVFASKCQIFRVFPVNFSLKCTYLCIHLVRYYIQICRGVVSVGSVGSMEPTDL